MYQYEILNETTGEVLAQRTTREDARTAKTYFASRAKGSHVVIRRWVVQFSQPTIVR